MKGFLRTDPYKCILCGDRLLSGGAQMGKKNNRCCQAIYNFLEKKRWLQLKHREINVWK
ncbi:hypothetical protein QE193_23250 (plasmid) [Arsenophonus nasoniae]|nr:hypothetical protein [Arsenophonus nasoniae]WGM18136.1 hypothetical protein QE193_23250 [Arsenophonus nasoniae]